MRRTVRLGLLFVLMLAACGGEPGEDGAVRLRLFLWRPESAAAWDEALERFHAEHPGIRVELEVGPNNSTQLHDLLAQKLRNGDSSVDVFLMDVVWTAEFARAGWARPLDDRLPPSERADFFPGCLAAATYGDGLFGVPFVADAGVLYYRKDLVPEPPRTWEALVRESERVAGDVSGLYGFSAQLKQYEGLICNVLEYVHANGGRLDEPASDEAVEAVRFIRDRIVGHAAPRGVLTYEEQGSLDLFRAGGAVFLRSWPYAFAACRGSPVEGKVGIAPLPAFEGGSPASALGGWNCGVSAFSRHPDEAWALVRFLTSARTQTHFALRTGKPPARTSPYRDAALLERYPHFGALAAAVETAVPRPRSPIYPRISHILQRQLHRAISESGSDVAALMREAATEIREARAELGE